MRTFTIALLFACFAGSVALADDPPQPSEKPQTATETSRLFKPMLPFGQFQYRVAPFPPRDLMVGHDCYTMRSYLMKREDKTDVTTQRGYTTCTPASHFRLRVVPGKPKR